MQNDLTFAQAADVARYFGGATYTVDHPTERVWGIFSKGRVLVVSTRGYTDALMAVGAWPDPGVWPPPSAARFVYVDSSVMRGSENVAVARSPSWAHRIADALNHHHRPTR